MSGPSDRDTIAAVLRSRARESPETTAFTYLLDGEDHEAPLTYGELDRQAAAITRALAGTVERGGRVVLMYEPGLSFIAALFGCMYAGTVPVPVHPPDPRRLESTLRRVAGIATDADAHAALTSSTIEPLLASLGTLAPGLDRLTWIVTDELGEDAGARALDMPRADELGLIQYTSGTTGEPKGVTLTHANLMAQSALVHEGFATGPDTVGVTWTPLTHDMGLLGSVLQPIYAGFPNVLMSPVAFLQRPLRWLRAISKYRGTACGGPNFTYELCARKASAEERAELDLSCWRIAYTGAEPVRADGLERFASAFAGAGFRREAFYPGWGLAEAGCVVSGHRGTPSAIVRHFDRGALEARRVVPVDPGTPAARVFVGSGRPLHGHTVAVVDPDSGEPCPPLTVGELWVRGPCVGSGYWNRPGLSDEVFGAQLPGSDERHLRTGDLGFLFDGQVFVVGRWKDVIIVRGRNLDSHDVELTVEHSCTGLRPGCGAAVAVETAGGESLAIVHEVADPEAIDASATIERIRGAVAYEHGVAPAVVALIEPRSIPKTSSGKLRRAAARAALVEGSLAVVASDPPGWSPVHATASAAA